MTYQAVQANIFTPNCAVSGCHVGGATAPFGLDLTVGQALANTVDVPSGQSSSFDRIDPFNATDSYIYMKVVADPRIGGDPMPAIGPVLTQAQIDLLVGWIEQGARP